MQAKWTDRQFLGEDWLLQPELRIDRLTQTISTDLYFPQWQNGWLPSLGGHYERTDISGEVNNRIRTDAKITSPDKRNEKTWTASYLTERQEIADVQTNYRRAMIGTFGYTMRRFDNLVSPRRGYAASIELSAGPAGVENKSNIARVVLGSVWLSPIERELQLKLRGQFGRVTGAGRQDIPSELLFRTGGDQTVRGYAFESLGVEDNGAIVGGRVMAVASAELTWWFMPEWGASIFQDAGNATDSLEGFRFDQGTGIGARWHSPVGTVNLDLAYGHEVHAMRVHFSIGHGF
jgi:translocation and assembly module TamA